MRIIGIDFGNQSLKAVELESAFGRFEIQDYHEIVRDPGQSNSELLTQLSSSLAKKPDRVAICLKTSRVTFRNLTLPSKDKKAIASSIDFEMEDELPFLSDQSVYDFSILGFQKNQTSVHVGATLKKYVAEVLGAFTDSGLDPDLVTSETWIYRTFLSRFLTQNTLDIPQDQPILMVNCGSDRTTLYAHHRGVPILSREIHWGGRNLTTTICQKFGIPLGEAERTKIDQGFILAPSQRESATSEQIEFSDSLASQVETLMDAIRQAELTTKSLSNNSLGSILLTGGSSLFPGLAESIQEQFDLPVKKVAALTTIGATGVTYAEQNDAVFLVALGLALTQVGQDRNTSLNLRKGSFAKVGQIRELNIKALRRPILAVASIVTCFVASSVIQTRYYQSRLEDIDAQLEKSVRSFFGTLSNSAVKTYLANTSNLKTSIRKEITKQKELGRLISANPHSPIDFLRELSVSTPKDAIVDLTQFQIGAATTASYSPSEQGTASLSFILANSQTADQLNKLLSSRVSDLQRGKIEESVDPSGKKSWRVTFSGKPTGDAYGK